MTLWTSSLIVSLLAASPVPEGAGPTCCRASFRVFAGIEVKYPEARSTLGASVAVIGCADILSSLSSAETSEINKAVKGMLKDVGPKILAKEDDQDFRTAVCSRINAALGREVAEDVFFFDLGYSEESW